jgi:PAS domain S-box-containing protein
MLIRCSPDLHYRFVSPAYAEMLGRQPQDIVGKALIEIVGQEGFAKVRPHIAKVLRGERAEYEHEVEYEGVGRRFLRGIYTPDMDENGRVVGWIASIVDLTDRKRAEEQRDLLMAEINHRVKNTLATVISIARQSFAKDRTFEVSQRSFTDRIQALAQTHTRLAEANWSGMSLESIIRDEVAPYRGSDNVRIAGPNLTLSPKQAVSLGFP